VKKKVKKLSLNKETLRHLHEEHLIIAAGGSTGICNPTEHTGPCSLCGSCDTDCSVHRCGV
jgi:hypothetical protein